MNKSIADGQIAPRGDHRRWLRRLELAHFEPSSPGMPYWLPNGVAVLRALHEHWRRAHEGWGYLELSTPLLARDSLYASSGHLDHFAGNMFFSEPEPGERYGLKPVNCPGTMVVFRSRRRSYRELPLRFACYDLLHRHELSGALSGLLRVQAFRQDDGHVFVAPERAAEEVLAMLRLAERLYAGFGLDFSLRLGGPPASHLGTRASWEHAESQLRRALDAYCGPDGYRRDEGEGAFYGPKVDLLARDSLGREWQLGTFQLDLEMPARLGCAYVGPDGAERVPAVVHRALVGSFERFLGVLLEHTDGHLPGFLAPVQLRLVAVASRHVGAAASLAELARADGFRVQLHGANQRVAAQVREARLRRVPLLGIVGDREEREATVSVRDDTGRDLGTLTAAGLVAALREHCRPPVI